MMHTRSCSEKGCFYQVAGKRKFVQVELARHHDEAHPVKVGGTA